MKSIILVFFYLTFSSIAHSQNASLLKLIQAEIKGKEGQLKYWDSLYAINFSKEPPDANCFYKGEIRGRKIQIIEDIYILKEQEQILLKEMKHD